MTRHIVSPRSPCGLDGYSDKPKVPEIVMMWAEYSHCEGLIQTMCSEGRHPPHILIPDSPMPLHNFLTKETQSWQNDQ